MAFVHGKGTSITVNAQDWSPFSDSVSVPRDIDTAATSHFGTQSKTYVTGMDDSKATISGLWDATLDGYIQTILTGQSNGTLPNVAVVYGPAGTTTGNVKFTFNAMITNYQVDGTAGDVVKYSVSLQRTGSTTTSVF